MRPDSRTEDIKRERARGPCGDAHPEEMRERTEVPVVPEESAAKKDLRPLNSITGWRAVSSRKRIDIEHEGLLAGSAGTGKRGNQTSHRSPPGERASASLRRP